jgi:photosystem II stability/assembly factor-like uncharacterized protein
MRRAGAIALALALLLAGLSIGGGATAAAPCEAVQQEDSWRTIKAPPGFDGRLTAVAAGGNDGSLVLASDGDTVLRSDDGGCQWEPSYAVSGATGVDGLPRVVQLLVPEGGGPALMVVDGIGRAGGSNVLTSGNGGKDWAEATGLPSDGGIRKLVAANDGDTRYLTTGVADAVGEVDNVGVTGTVYASKDGGATWAQASRGPQIADLEVDPRAPSRIYAVRSNRQVVVSADGGGTWEVLNAPTAPWRDIAVQRLPDQPATVAISASESPEANTSRVAVSDKGGSGWTTISNEGLGPPGGLVFGAVPGQLYAAGASTQTTFRGPGLRHFDSNRWVDVDTAFSLDSLRDPVRVPAAGTNKALYFRRDHPDAAKPDLIARFDPPPADNDRLVLDLDAKKCQERPFEPPTPPKVKPARFTTDPVKVSLQPGVPSEAGVRVSIPPTASPLDIYFLVDTSNSMDNAIDGVFCGIERIQRDLASKHGDSWFGVGAFNDTTDYRYKRIVEVSPPGPKIHEALKNLFTRRGDMEPLRTPLFQSVTGAGVYKRNATEANPDAEPDLLVPPGQQANFRDGALKIIPLIADDPYDEQQPDEPLKEEVVSALKDEGVMVIGLPVTRVAEQGADGTPESQGVVQDVTRPALEAQLRTQLDYFTRETGSLAPRGGVDCNGDGTQDVAQGQPLICPIPNGKLSTEIDDTILTILRGLDDVRKVRIVPSKTDGLIVKVKGGEADLDLKKDNALDGVASIECTPAQAGRKYQIAFDAVIGRRVLATLPGEVVCGELPVLAVAPPRVRKQPEAAPVAKPKPPPVQPAIPPPAPPPTPQAAIALPPPPPPPTPAPVSSNAPIVQSATSSAAQSAAAPSGQVTPQVGFAAAQQARQDAQVAQIRSDEGRHAMVASRPTAFARANRRLGERAFIAEPGQHHGPVHSALMTLGIGACGAFGYAAVVSARTRRRIREAQARYGG